MSKDIDKDIIQKALESVELKNDLNIILDKLDIILDNIFDDFDDESYDFTLKDNIKYFNINILKLYQQQLTKIIESKKSDLLSNDEFESIRSRLELLINVNYAIQNELKTKQI